MSEKLANYIQQSIENLPDPWEWADAFNKKIAKRITPELVKPLQTRFDTIFEKCLENLTNPPETEATKPVPEEIAQPSPIPTEKAQHPESTEQNDKKRRENYRSQSAKKINDIIIR